MNELKKNCLVQENKIENLSQEGKELKEEIKLKSIEN